MTAAGPCEAATPGVGATVDRASPARLRGIFAPVLTPFAPDLQPDGDRLVRHGRWLLAQGVGLAVFGTNSEANSLALVEKRRLLDGLLAAGLPAARMMPGTGGCALPEVIELTRHAVAAGCGGVLMLPPFYYKGVSDEGLFRAYARVIDGVADERLRIYLYHIPQVSGVPIPPSLIERLLQHFPGTVAGIKDSGGDGAHTLALLQRFQPQGFDVFAGSENFLLAVLRGGGAGCITATGNVNPAAIVQLYQTWQLPGAEARQQQLDAVRAVFARFPMIAAMKAAIAQQSGRRDWQTVRPPLVELDAGQQQALAAALQDLGFEMQGVAALA